MDVPEVPAPMETQAIPTAYPQPSHPEALGWPKALAHTLRRALHPEPWVRWLGLARWQPTEIPPQGL